LAGLLVLGCGPKHTETRVPEPAAAPAAALPEVAPADLLEAAEAALEGDNAAHAVALFGRYLASDGAAEARRAYLGLGRAHEILLDCQAAVTTYSGFLDQFPGDGEALHVHARIGACEAELGHWERSAASFRTIRDAEGQLPSVYIEAMAREGYALFNLERWGEADDILAEADAVFDKAVQEQSERFSSYYFMGMARFYRAAIIHLKFRDVKVELPEKVMEEAFKQKMELLVAAQDAYNHTIKAKHMFWVSASGFQLGHLFGEFYDQMMYAPMPEWLDDRQRQIYYEELKKQLRPVVKKAIWVFEKNLETARRLGYESPFTAQTQAKLGHLQKILLSDEAGFGQPHPRLVPETVADVGAQAGNEQLPPEDRKLYVPRPTPL
jgi:tetratricopeptide (TPR) repeat protein